MRFSIASPSFHGTMRVMAWDRIKRLLLESAGMLTVAALRKSDDATLLAFKGIGPAKLAAIRKYCDAFDGDPHAERLTDIAL